jgi:hypothetical protein
VDTMLYSGIQNQKASGTRNFLLCINFYTFKGYKNITASATSHPNLFFDSNCHCSQSIALRTKALKE